MQTSAFFGGHLGYSVAILHLFRIYIHSSSMSTEGSKYPNFIAMSYKKISLICSYPKTSSSINFITICQQLLIYYTWCNIGTLFKDFKHVMKWFTCWYAFRITLYWKPWGISLALYFARSRDSLRKLSESIPITVDTNGLVTPAAYNIKCNGCIKNTFKN